MSIAKKADQFKTKTPKYGGWFRFYNGAIDDPKIQRLPPHLLRAWVNLLCIASKDGGILPGRDEIAFRLRMSIGDASSAIEDLVIAGLIDVRPDGNLEPHNWPSRQPARDKSVNRMRRLRARRKRALKQAVTQSDASRDGSGDVNVPISSSSTEGKKNHHACCETVVTQDEGGDVGRGDSDRQIHGKPTCSTKDGDRGTSAHKVVRTAGGDA